MKQKEEVTQLAQTNTNVQMALANVEQEKALFALAQEKAKMYASSTIVPIQYQGEKNIGNVIIALDMAQRMKANPLMVMQNLYTVHGNVGWSSKFLIATVNSCGRFTPLRYEFATSKGVKGCRAYAYEKSDTERKSPLYGTWVSMDMAQKEGWLGKNGSKWQTMPDLMLQYRAAAFWQRVYAPEIGMGLMTAEELEDTNGKAISTVEEITPEEVKDDFSMAMQSAMSESMGTNAVNGAEIAPQGENNV